MYKITILFAILRTLDAQLVSSGQCSFLNLSYYEEKVNATPPENIYELTRIRNTWNTGQCATWALKADISSGIIVSRREVVNRKLIERNSTGSGNMDGSITFTFTDFTSNFTFLGLAQEFFIVYACSNRGNSKEEYSWVLSSKTVLSAAAKNLTENILKNNKLDAASWEEISHSADSCKSGGTSNFKITPIIILIAGLLISKDLQFFYV